MTKPLPTFILTRERGRNQELADLLTEADVPWAEAPVIRTSPMPCADALRAELKKLREGDALVFTSANAIRHMDTAGIDMLADALVRGVRTWSVGEATASALMDAGLEAHHISAGRHGADLAYAMLESAWSPERALLLRAKVAQPDLPRILKAAKMKVGEVAVYETTSDLDGQERFRQLCDQHESATFVWCSPSAVVAGFGCTYVRHVDVLHDAFHFSLGPTTSDELEEFGIEADMIITAPGGTIESLAEVIIAMFNLIRDDVPDDN